MRTLTATMITEKNALNTPSAWLLLLQVSVSDAVTLYLVPNPSAVVFGGITYQPFGCQLDLVKSDSKGGLAEVDVRIDNVTRAISAYVEANDLRGRRVTIIGVHSAHLSDPTQILFQDDYEINEILVTEAIVTVRLGHERLLAQRFPNGRVLRDNCRWIYKSLECGYVGALATCDKNLEGTNGCRAHANQGRFGGFPALPQAAGQTILW